MAYKVSDILGDIYDKIFLRELDYSINIFLCGANPSDRNSLRNIIYSELENHSRYNVVFPESLFSNLLIDKQHNLLMLEQELAANVDVIVLPLEGLGTMAELGAFASFDKLRSKMIILNEGKFKTKRSFISLGPVQLVKSENKKSVIYYDKDENGENITEESLSELKKNVLRRIKSFRQIGSKVDIKNFFNLSRFILYLIAIFQPIDKTMIESMLADLKKGISPHFIQPCLDTLGEKRKITREIRNYVDYYFLTDSGHNYIYEDLLPRLHIIKSFSKMRAKVISDYNRKINTLNLDGVRDQFLVA